MAVAVNTAPNHPAPVPDRARGQYRERRAVRIGPRRHVKVRLGIAAIAGRKAHPDGAGAAGGPPGGSPGWRCRSDAASSARATHAPLRGARSDEVAQQERLRWRTSARARRARRVTAAKRASVAHDVVRHLVARHPKSRAPERLGCPSERLFECPPGERKLVLRFPLASTTTKVRSDGRSPRRLFRGVIPPTSSPPAARPFEAGVAVVGHRREQRASAPPPPPGQPSAGRRAPRSTRQGAAGRAARTRSAGGDVRRVHL